MQSENTCGERLALGKAEQSRIQAEEVFREEIKRQLADSRPPKPLNLWQILNSALVLWLLGVVVVTLLIPKLSAHIAKASEAARQERVNNEQEQKILFEANERLNRFLAAVATKIDDEEYRVAFTLLTAPILSEFDGRDLTSLAWELEGLRSGSGSNTQRATTRAIRRCEDTLTAIKTKLNLEIARKTAHELQILINGEGTVNASAAHMRGR